MSAKKNIQYFEIFTKNMSILPRTVFAVDPRLKEFDEESEAKILKNAFEKLFFCEK